MNDKSSYLRFLPPVLWQAEPDAPEFSLGSALRIFEKILTGIDDGVPIRHTAADNAVVEHAPIGEVIGSLHRLFDPMTAPAGFLPWLAQWVSLEFPSVWEEYQRRRATADMAAVFQQRGLRRGLLAALAVHSVSSKRPRVAIDEGARVLVCTPAPGRFAPINTLVGYGPVARRDKTLVHGGLMRPSCIARAADGTLYLGDAGTPAQAPYKQDEGVWAVAPTGAYKVTGAPPMPRAVGPDTWVSTNTAVPIFPRALAMDTANPWNLYVLDGVTQHTLYRLASPAFSTVTQVATKDDLKLVNPVAMAMDSNGHLLILDRGNSSVKPAVVDVQLSPLLVTARTLTKVIEAQSLALLPGGDLLVGDGGVQTTATPAQLVRVSRTGATWVETPLLPATPGSANPLVAPVGVVEFTPGLLLVLDAGLKPLRADPADPYNREIAEPAALYWVDTRTTVPTVTRASELNAMVLPTGMVFDGKNVYISDSGEPDISGTARVTRALPHEFSAVVHFCKQRSTTSLQRRQIVGDITNIINRNKPAHTNWALITSV